MDSLNTTLWDSKTQQYTEYGRWWYGGGYGGRRGVYMKQSSTWDGTWTGSRQFILDPANNIPAGSTNYFDIYTPGVQQYYGQYVGLPTIYHHPGSWSTSGAVYPSFMYSRDGANWSIPDAYQPIIDLSAHGQNESNFGQAYTATSMVDRNGQLYIYYSYFPENHNSSNNSASGGIYLATLPEDRFEGIQSAPGSVGTWTTSAITLSNDPGHLILNALVEGSLRVEVLDALTMTPLAGFSGDRRHPWLGRLPQRHRRVERRRHVERPGGPNRRPAVRNGRRHGLRLPFRSCPRTFGNRAVSYRADRSAGLRLAEAAMIAHFGH